MDHTRNSKEQQIRRNVQPFRDGLVLKAHGLLYHSTIGLGVKKEENGIAKHTCSDAWCERCMKYPDADGTHAPSRRRQDSN